MDVRGPQRHGPLDDQVDQTDHRGFAGHVAQLLDILLAGRFLAGDPGENVAHLAAPLAIKPLDG